MNRTVLDGEAKRRIAASAELLGERRRNDHTAGSRVDEELPGKDAPFLDGHIAKRFDGVERYAGFDEWPDDEKLPEWIDIFSDLLVYAVELDDPRSAADDLDRRPFVDVFGPIVEYARRRFVDADTDRLSGDAMLGLENHLLNRLVEIGAQALHVDFMAYVTEREPAVVENDRRSPNSTERYDGYVIDFFDGRFEAFFERYPMVARLVVLVVQQWGSMVSEFASRLNDDYRSLHALLDAEDLGRVRRLDPGAGDRHANGQSVVIVAFDSGDEVVYKPRGLAPEKQLYEFVSWLHRRFESFPELQTVKLIDQSTHGWMQKLDRTPFPSLDVAGEYYRRTGAFLCVLYLLCASDCHYENVIADTISPVLVDAETVPSAPAVEDPEPTFEQAVQRHVYRDSLLETMALPVAFDGQKIDHSGIGMVDATTGKRRKVSWRHVNTDAMDVEFRHETKGPGQNVPTYGGDPVPPGRFVDEIVDGFRTGYDSVATAPDEVKRRLTEQFAGVRVRNVLRESMEYGALLDTLTNPTYLRNGVEYACKIENTLAERFASLSVDTDAVLDAERRAILRRDVPRFTTAADECEIHFDGEVVCSLKSAESGLERMRKRVDGLSADDRERQIEHVRACLGGVSPTNGEHACDIL